jgi:thiol:disulfide interchange protein DsbA
MRRDDALVLAYHVDGTPSLLVNGKYRITVQSAGGMQQMIEVAKYLVAQESKAGANARAAQAGSSAPPGRRPVVR